MDKNETAKSAPVRHLLWIAHLFVTHGGTNCRKITDARKVRRDSFENEANVCDTIDKRRGDAVADRKSRRILYTFLLRYFYYFCGLVFYEWDTPGSFAGLIVV